MRTNGNQHHEIYRNECRATLQFSRHTEEKRKRWRRKIKKNKNKLNR